MNTFEYKILIVDDVAKNIQVVGNILQSHNFDIYFANNGKNALRQIRINTFDLILLDVMMPEMDGFQVCAEIKKLKHAKDTPIIFLTAKTDIESIVKGFESGGVDYITKPFNSIELLARIKTHLSLRDAQTNLLKKNKEIEKQKKVLETAYEKLKKSEEELQEINIAKDKFFTIIAHDLKNPLNSLIGFTDLLLKGDGNLEDIAVKEIYQLIHNASKYGFNLLENLLEWSRSQTGRLNIKRTRFNINEIIAETIDLLQSTAQKKGISLKNTTQTECFVFADKNMINTVVRNLISNALKFTDKNGKITVSSTEKDNKYIISIKDTGLGIKEKDLNNLFRIDKNVSTLGTEQEKGTGLGLILCKEFIDKNKGKIFVESKYGEGSNFFFELPKNNDEISDSDTNTNS